MVSREDLESYLVRLGAEGASYSEVEPGMFVVRPGGTPDAQAVLPGVARGSEGAEGRVLQSDAVGVGLLVKADPAGGERVIGIVSSGPWSLAGLTPGQPISALARLGRVVDRDADTYVYVVSGHLVRVITDGTVIRSVIVRTDR